MTRWRYRRCFPAMRGSAATGSVTVRMAGLERRFLVNREVRGAPRQEQMRLNRRHRRVTRWMAFICLPLVALARLIRPIVLLRFGRFLRHKIGHCPLEAEMYL